MKSRPNVEAEAEYTTIDYVLSLWYIVSATYIRACAGTLDHGRKCSGTTEELGIHEKPGLDGYGMRVRN